MSEKRPNYRAWTGAELTTLLEMCSRGKSTAAIALALGRSYHSVAYRRRKSCGRRPGRPKEPTPERLRVLLWQGQSDASLQDVYGYGRLLIRRTRRELGLSASRGRRPRGARNVPH